MLRKMSSEGEHTLSSF